MDDNKTLIAARAYLARGLAVFPLNGKVPTTDHGVKDASTDEAQIVEWFPRARNIAIAIPPGCVVVDIDPRNGGEESFKEWRDAYGTDWWTGPMALTGGNGQHYWFKYDGRKLKKNPAPGVDLLTHGRYVVAPPSSTITTYRWLLTLPSQLDELPAFPDWLYVLSTPERVEIESPARPFTGGDALNEAAHQYASWAGLLSRHGWKYVGGGSNEYGDDGTKWRHPASDNPFSATLKHDCLFVYSPNTPFPVTESGDPHGVTLFTAIETLDYGGNRRAFLSALRERGLLPERIEPADVDALLAPPGLEIPATDVELPLGDPIDWPLLWTQDDDIEQRWLSEPLVARGRSHALYAGAKTGKSLLLLQLAAALAAGRPFLDKPAHDPIPVLYADYEMTADDVRERLEGFGYGPPDLLLLHYFLLGSGRGLDTLDGGEALVVTALRLQVELVVVDTTARAVAGAENDADTLRAFYRFTGARLKRKGVAAVRLDHSGKDVTKGQRGTSAKNDDVDVVWRMTRRDADAFDLEATHQRMGWVEHKVPLVLHEDERTGLVDWRRRGGGRTYPERTKETAELLDSLDAPLSISKSDAAALLRRHGWRGRNQLILDAFAWRAEVHSHDYLGLG